jgi:peroxiredoxin
MNQITHYIYTSIAALAAITGFSCCGNAPANRLTDGLWRGELMIQHRPAPFLFEIAYAGTDSARLTFHNGEERMTVAGVRQDADTVIIPVEAYDTQLKACLSGNRMTGRFLRNYMAGDSGVPFQAVRGDAPRFPSVGQMSGVAPDGTWDVFFLGNDTVRNVGIFTSENRVLTGSVLTRSGDYRYLEGVRTENGALLSAFSGKSPYLIELNFRGRDTFEGVFYTERSRTPLLGVRNDRAALEDAFSLTWMKEGAERLHFRLPDTEGRPVSLDDARYRGKVVIVTVLGTWCHNCLDEAAFLAPWYAENRDRDVEIIGLAFERKGEFDQAIPAVKRLQKQFGIEYALLFAGRLGAESIARVLPEVANFSSYPTTFFIDRQGRVRRIHTGYSGPATGQFYENFRKEFNATVDLLLAEPLEERTDWK